MALSGLEAVKVFRRGEPLFASKPDGKRRETSGFNVAVSEASWDGVAGQISDAIAFLKKNEAVILMLRSASGVEDIRLDFPVDLRIDRVKVFGQCDYFPPELVSLAGALGIGIEISIYPRDLETLASGAAESAPIA